MLEQQRLLQERQVEEQRALMHLQAETQLRAQREFFELHGAEQRRLALELAERLAPTDSAWAIGGAEEAKSKDALKLPASEYEEQQARQERHECELLGWESASRLNYKSSGLPQLVVDGWARTV